MARKKAFHLPKGVKDITTTPAPYPSIDLIKKDLKRLKFEFLKNNLSEYIDIYGGNYAMKKMIYIFENFSVESPIPFKKYL